VDGADVRVLEGRRRLGLLDEAPPRLGVFGQLRRQELEGDGALQASVLGPEDHTHAARTQLLDDPVVRDRPADHVPSLRADSMTP